MLKMIQFFLSFIKSEFTKSIIFFEKIKLIHFGRGIEKRTLF